MKPAWESFPCHKNDGATPPSDIAKRPYLSCTSTRYAKSPKDVFRQQKLDNSAISARRKVTSNRRSRGTGNVSHSTLYAQVATVSIRWTACGSPIFGNPRPQERFPKERDRRGSLARSHSFLDNSTALKAIPRRIESSRR